MKKWKTKDLDFLKILISKSTEQSELYYKRLGLYITLITIIIGGSITIVVSGSEKLNPKTLWTLTAIATMIGAIFFWFWYKIMVMSNVWVQFWRQKIQLFEIDQSPDNSNYWFMRGIVTFDNEFIDRLSIETYSSENQEAINEYKQWYEQLPRNTGGVSNLFLGLIKTFGIMLLLMSIVCISLAIGEFL